MARRDVQRPLGAVLVHARARLRPDRSTERLRLGPNPRRASARHRRALSGRTRNAIATQLTRPRNLVRPEVTSFEARGPKTRMNKPIVADDCESVNLPTKPSEARPLEVSHFEPW